MHSERDDNDPDSSDDFSDEDNDPVDEPVQSVPAKEEVPSKVEVPVQTKDEVQSKPRRWLVASVLALLGAMVFVLMLQSIQCPLIKDPNQLYAFSASARLLWIASFAFIVLYAVIYTGTHP